ncbi:MAG TPA: hypothetical protein VGN88_03870, partial [Phycisphaerae bacterium]
MSEAIEPTAGEGEGNSAGGEPFWGVVWRRGRYALAIVISAVLFCWVGWKVAAPPPEWGGVSLATWQSQSYFSAFLLAVILLVAT